MGVTLCPGMHIIGQKYGGEMDEDEAKRAVEMDLYDSLNPEQRALVNDIGLAAFIEVADRERRDEVASMFGL